MDTFRQAGDSLAGRFLSWRLHPVSVKEWCALSPQAASGQAPSPEAALAAAPSAAKDCPKPGVGQNEVCRSLKFRRKCKPKFKICSRRLESRSIVQLCECD